MTEGSMKSFMSLQGCCSNRHVQVETVAQPFFTRSYREEAGHEGK